MIILMITFILLAQINIIRPIKQMVASMKLSVDKGDLSICLDSQGADEISELASAYNEQMQSTAITQIDQVTQKNSALVERTAHQTMQMGELAQEVIAVTKRFKVDLKQINFERAMQSGIFNFAHARRAHRQWLGVIQAMIEGIEVNFNHHAATDHTQCELGKWHYHGEGQQFANLPEMQKVEKWHIQLHALIKSIIEAHHTDQDEDKIDAMLDELAGLSKKVIDALNLAEDRAIQLMNQNNSVAKIGK